MGLVKRYLGCLATSIFSHLVYKIYLQVGTRGGYDGGESLKLFTATFSGRESLVSILAVGYLLTYVTSTHTKDGELDENFRQHPYWKNIMDDLLDEYSVDAEEALDEKKQYIIGCFPHGANSVQHLLTMTDCCGALSKVHKGPRRDLAASILFYIPVIRELSLLLGNVDASGATAQYNLKKQRSLLIFVGGEKEQLMTTEGEQRVYLKSRKGFVKLALQYGCDLVPSYAFGENELYHISNFALDFRQWLQRCFSVGLCVATGKPRWWNWFAPLKRPLHVKFGKPIKVEKKDKSDITQDDIEKLHAEFVSALEGLFSKHSKGKTLEVL